jgi:tetratricopeptide (TPR) repeat protein
MKPRIFVSAVTSELGQTRQLVANVLSRLGYDPVWQDIFGTEPGDLRQVLRDKIDDCQGLIQIVGRAYGSEPPDVDPQFGRVSYTQFEFLYAQSRGKKTWLIFADDGCTHDRPLDQLDLPHDPAHPDPAAYQTQRRALQAAWWQRWRPSTHLWYLAGNDDKLELWVERLKDEFAELRREFRDWQKNVTENLATIAQQLEDLNPDLVREQLRKTIEATYQRDLAQAETLHDWQQREEARKAAQESRQRRLGQVEEFLQSITSTIQAGDASPEFLELTRILQEQGVEAALAYATSQQSRLLEQAASLVARQQREVRRTLAPLLEGVRLHGTRGELRAAELLGGKLLAADANWPEALHEHFWTQVELGDRALRYETLSAAKIRFEAAHASARRLVHLADNNPDDTNPKRQREDVTSPKRQREDDTNPKRQREDVTSPKRQREVAQARRDLSVSYDRLGEVQLQSGQVTEALGSYQQGLEIRQKLAAADPSDAHAQRDLSVSYEKLGDVQLQSGQVTEALKSFNLKFEISKKLAAADPSDAVAQRDRFISLGDVQLQSGQVTEALGSYQQALEIRQKLAAADPSDAQAQLDLVVSHHKIASVQQEQKQYEQAIESYGRGLKVLQALKDRKRLAPANERWIGIVEEAIAECRKLMDGSLE